MQEYRTHHAFFRSFFDANLYRDVALNWRGTGILYLTLLLAICWLPVSLRAGLGIYNFAHNDITEALDMVPRINIANGIASYEGEQPLTIPIPPEERGGTDLEYFLYLDTTLTELPDSTAAMMTLTKTQLKTVTERQTRIYELTSFPDVTVSKEGILTWLNYLAVGIVLCYPLCLVFSLIFRLFIATIVSLPGLMLNSPMGLELSYQTIFRLAIVASTPVIILKTLCNLISIGELVGFIVSVIVSAGYLIFALIAVKGRPEEDQPEETESEWSY